MGNLQTAQFPYRDAFPPIEERYGHSPQGAVSSASGRLEVSGQIGQRMDGTIPDDIVKQSPIGLTDLEAQLKAAGMTLDNLVKITTIIPNGGDVVAAREARSKALGDRKPASTLVVGGLANPAWKIEIEGIAVA